MDVCLQLLIAANTDDLSYDSAKAARRLIDGDIQQALEPTTIATYDGKDWIPDDVVGSPRCGFIFITGIPDGVTTIERINEVLSRSDITYTDIPLARPTAVKNNIREWNISIGAMNPPTRNALLADRYVTISFNQLRSWCFSKRTSNAVDLTDFVI